MTRRMTQDSGVEQRFIDPLVPLPEAASALGISVHAAYKRIARSGTLHPMLPTIHRGVTERHPRIFVDRQELRTLLEAGDA